MTARPDRLQGTDGIRGVVAPDDAESRSDPVGAFLRTEKLTPSFAELYARAFAEEETAPGGEVVVGWDPRDREGTFTGAVVRGVRLSGRKPIVLGTVPTPALPLAMIHRGARAGIMVTASHNPESQNGLKLFLGPLATKLYPADETRLTRRVYVLGDRQPAGPAEPDAEPLEWAAEARSLFVEYTCDPYNAWLPVSGAPEGETRAGPLADLLLVIDASGGGLAGIAREAFRRLGAREVIEVNGLGAPVNQGGGVVELEQVRWVGRDCAGDGGKDLSGHAGVTALLDAVRDRRQDLLAGRAWAAAAVFDGDGDRCVLLVYDPFRDGLAVLDGDRVGLHLARHLASSHPDAYRDALYVNTVDSDLAAGGAAALLGFRSEWTAVGDKWLLWRAGLSWARALAEAGGGSGGELKALEAGQGDARSLGEFCRALSGVPPAPLFAPGRVPFAVGSEASGHHVTLGRSGETHPCPVFAGNGLKAAVNAFAAMRRPAPGRGSPQEWIGAVCRPFEAGYRRTLYAFYTDRARFAPGTEAWEKMDRLLHAACEVRFGQRYRMRRVHVPEDPGMLYVALEDGEGVRRAGVFVRNSGTEERTGVTAQGGTEDAPALDFVAGEALKALLLDLKREGHPYGSAEAALLNRLLREAMSPEVAEAGIGEDVEAARLLKEMERQGLIRREGGRLAATDLGRWYGRETSLRGKAAHGRPE